MTERAADETASLCVSVRSSTLPPSATLVRRFQEIVCVAPMACITDWRIMKARNLVVHATMPLEQTAERTGFASVRTLQSRQPVFSLGLPRCLNCQIGFIQRVDLELHAGQCER